MSNNDRPQIEYRFSIIEADVDRATVYIFPTAPITPEIFYRSILDDSLFTYKLGHRLESSITKKTARIYITPKAYFMELKVNLDSKLFNLLERRRVDIGDDIAFRLKTELADQNHTFSMLADTAVDIVPSIEGDLTKDKYYTYTTAVVDGKGPDEINTDTLAHLNANITMALKNTLYFGITDWFNLTTQYSECLYRDTIAINASSRLTHINGNYIYRLTEDEMEVRDDTDTEEERYIRIANIVARLPGLLSSTDMLTIPTRPKISVRKYNENTMEFYSTVNYALVQVNLREDERMSGCLNARIILTNNKYSIAQIIEKDSPIKYIVLHKGRYDKDKTLKDIYAMFVSRPLLKMKLRKMEVHHVIDGDIMSVYAIQKQ